MKYKKQKEYPIIIKEKGKTIQIFLNEIVYISCDGHVCTLHLVDDSNISTYKLIKDYEIEFEDYFFTRASRKVLVNCRYIQSIDSNGTNSIELKNGEFLAVSRRNVKKINEILSL
jgi:DNA-binding LytR/AlgR family response regulator